MHTVWIFNLILLMVVGVKSNEAAIENLTVISQKMIDEWMSNVEQSVLPLPPSLVRNLTKRTGEISFPVLTDAGKCRAHSELALQRVLEKDTWALSKSDDPTTSSSSGGERQIYEWVSKLQQVLMPLPEGVPQFLAFRSAKLLLPMYADAGQCRTDSEVVLQKVLKADIWALSMLDSSSRLRMGSGLLDGRLQDLGNYDQCKRAREPSGQFVGQHCMVDVEGIFPQELYDYFARTNANGSHPGNTFSFTLCVPSSCSSEDIVKHVNRTLDIAKLNKNTTISAFCADRIPPHFRTKDWCAVCVFVTIALLVFLSTCYEWKASGKKSELLSAFSIISNWQDLTDTKGSPDIACLDGIRIICALAVLITHRLLLYFFIPYFNFTSYVEHRESLLYGLIGSGSMATETFFVVSGIVRTYSFLKARYAGKPLNHSYHSIQRYFRVTPIMAMAVLFTSTLAIHVSDGPMWGKGVYFDEELCNHLWFLNLLHQSNWTALKCRVESWFLAADYQLYLLSPLLLLPLFRRPRLGLLLLAACFSFSTLAKMASTYFTPLYPDIVTNEGPKMHRYFSAAHSNTFYRLGAFVMGIVLGYYLYEAKHSKRKITISKYIVWLGWALTVAVLVATPPLHSKYFQADFDDNRLMSVFYLGVWERVVAAAACWVILACTLGHGGWVNSFLSWPVLRPFAKLSFGIYMTHMSVQMMQVFRTRQPLDFVPVDTIYLAIGDMVVACLLGTVLYLTVEMPFYRVATHMLKDKLASAPASAQKKDQQKEKKKKN